MPRAERLAQRIVDGRGVPSEFSEDALRVTATVAAEVDCIVTWSFARIANPFTKTMVRRAIENEGYECPEIASRDTCGGENP
jgi:hypothetical protein